MNVAIIVLFYITYTNTLPIDLPKTKTTPSVQVLDFMKQYGYLEESDDASAAIYSENGLSETIKLLQRFGGVPESGKFDNKTLQLIKSPRCGVKDVNQAERVKRFALNSHGWNKRTISYFIANWSPKLGQETVTNNIQLALETWGRYSHLIFKRKSNPDADIIVSFARGYHGDQQPFDGPGLTLAHAFSPSNTRDISGDIHFDDDENWVDLRSDPDRDGTDFFTVALHELGHSLGLSHSTDTEAVMFPYYRGSDPDAPVRLGYDDILGLYQLYVRGFQNIQEDEEIDDEEPRTQPSTTTTRRHTTATTTRSTTSTTNTPESTTVIVNSRNTGIYENDTEEIDVHRKHEDTGTTLPYICDGYFDAVSNIRQELFIFKKQFVWRLKGLAKKYDGYPIKIHQMFPDLPHEIRGIDGAYERPDGQIILFTANKYWVYDGQRFIEDSPRPLTDYGLPEDLDKIDAVQIWARNDKTYFYRGNQFWRFNETTKTMDDGYPRHVEKWRGVPENMDSAVTWKEVTYFFKAELYWTFDNNWVMITDTSPMPAPQVWLGCPEDETNMRRLYNYNY